MDAKSIINKYTVGTFDDFKLVTELKNAGYKIEMQNLVDTITESTYELTVRDKSDEIVATSIISSEEGVGTIIKEVR